jgi:hypothetical protein
MPQDNLKDQSSNRVKLPKAETKWIGEAKSAAASCKPSKMGSGVVSPAPIKRQKPDVGPGMGKPGKF